jgi:hypothetical protein
MELTKDELMTLLAAVSQYVIQLNKDSGYSHGSQENRNDIRSAIAVKTKIKEELRERVRKGLTE